MSIALFHTSMWKHLLFVFLNIVIVKCWAKKKDMSLGRIHDLCYWVAVGCKQMACLRGVRE